MQTTVIAPTTYNIKEVNIYLRVSGDISCEIMVNRHTMGPFDNLSTTIGHNQQ